MKAITKSRSRKAKPTQSRASTRARGSGTTRKKATARRKKIGLILVPIDFSTASISALEQAVDFAKQFKARLLPLHVIEPIVHSGFTGVELLTDVNVMTRGARKQLETVCQKTVKRGAVPVQTMVLHGIPHYEIVEAARKAKADLIIMPTHGYTGLKHITMGSTAERVVRHAPCPVLVLRGK